MATRGIYLVEWLDPTSQSQWQSEDEAHKAAPLRCVSIGSIIESTPKKIVIAATFSATGNVSDVTVIPKGSLVRKRRLATIQVPK